MADTHQICLGRVLVVGGTVGGCLAESVGLCHVLDRLGVLPIGGALRGPAKEVDGFPHTALNVDLCRGGWYVVLFLVLIDISCVLILIPFF